MYRTTSTTRAWDDQYSSHSSASSSKLESGEMSDYEPFLEGDKKEKAASKFAGNAVHIIPFVLLFCAFVLWFFSNPDVDVTGNALAAKLEVKTIEGDLDSDATGHAAVDLGDLDPTELRENKFMRLKNKIRSLT